MGSGDSRWCVACALDWRRLRCAALVAYAFRRKAHLLKTSSHPIAIWKQRRTQHCASSVQIAIGSYVQFLKAATCTATSTVPLVSRCKAKILGAPFSAGVLRGRAVGPALDSPCGSKAAAPITQHDQRRGQGTVRRSASIATAGSCQLVGSTWYQ